MNLDELKTIHKDTINYSVNSKFLKEDNIPVDECLQTTQQKEIHLKIQIEKSRKRRRKKITFHENTSNNLYPKKDYKNLSSWVKSLPLSTNKSNSAVSNSQQDYSLKKSSPIQLNHEAQILNQTKILTLKDKALFSNNESKLFESEDELENSNNSHLNSSSSNQDLVDQHHVIAAEGNISKKKHIYAVNDSADDLPSNPSNNIVDHDIAKNLDIDFQKHNIELFMFKQATDIYSPEEYETFELKKLSKTRKKEKLDKRNKTKHDNQPFSTQKSDNQTYSRKKTKKFQEDNEDFLEKKLEASIIAARRLATNKKEKSTIIPAIIETKKPDSINETNFFTSGSIFSSYIQSCIENQSQNIKSEPKSQKNQELIVHHYEIDNKQNVINMDEEDHLKEEPDSIASALNFFKRRGQLNSNSSKSDEREIVIGRSQDSLPIVDNDGKGDFVLEYRDKQGHLMSSKEAFRQLNYSFHGIRPGLNKQTKRLDKLNNQKKKVYSNSFS